MRELPGAEIFVCSPTEGYGSITTRSFLCEALIEGVLLFAITESADCYPDHRKIHCSIIIPQNRE